LLGSLLLFFKKAWKLVIVAIAALAASIKKIFDKISGRKSGSETNY